MRKAWLHELVMAIAHWYLARHCGAPAKVDLVRASGKTCILVPTKADGFTFRICEECGQTDPREKNGRAVALPSGLNVPNMLCFAHCLMLQHEQSSACKSTLHHDSTSGGSNFI